jgi:hypothetical protein
MCDCWRWVGFFKNVRISTHFCATFFLSIDYVLILTKNGFGYILGDFSQTHLVTLIKKTSYLFDVTGQRYDQLDKFSCL